MDTSETTFPITTIPSYFKTVGTASGALLSSANLEVSQGTRVQFENWHGLATCTTGSWEVDALFSKRRQFNSMYVGYCMP